MVKLGLVTGSVTPRPIASPRVKVVLPEPTSPTNSIIVAEDWEWVSFFAKFVPKSIISCSDLIIIV